MPRFHLLVVLGLVISMIGCSATDDDAADDDAGDDDAGDDDSAPAEIENPEATLVGEQYFLDFGTGEFVEPEGAGGIFSQYFADWYVPLLIVTALDEQAGTIAINFVGNAAPATPGTWDNPAFAVGPLDGLGPESGEMVVFGTLIDGVFADGGATMTDVTVAATIDTRVLDDLIDPDAEEGAGCELLADLEIPCVPCPDSGDPYCLAIVVEHVSGERFIPR